MENSSSPSWLHANRKQWFIVAVVFVLLFGAVTFFSYPVYFEYETPGGLTAVSDIGIEGSVYFVWVYSGITSGWMERYLVGLDADEDAHFYRISPYYATYSSNLDIQSDYREETITHAFEAVMEMEEEPTLFQRRLDEVLDQSADYYGDSMGLMVAIGLMEERYQIDYSRGGQYKIAGTGTMEEDLTVGSIGAMEQKLVMAERSGVTHFFIPDDEDIFGEDSNLAEARHIKDDRHLPFEIIPVRTLYEAIDYLDRLP